MRKHRYLTIEKLYWIRPISGRQEDDQNSIPGRPQPFSGRRGHVETHIFLPWNVYSGYVRIFLDAKIAHPMSV